ncbi:MAG: methyltransferase domain-containing protein [Dehalococcoidia bacterium]
MTVETTPAAPAVREEDGASLSRYLLSFRWPYRDDAVSRHLVRGGLPLWRQILRFVPNPKERGRALELGSPPFHITLLMQKLRNYDLQLTAYPSDDRRELVQEIESPEYGERHRYVCVCFDAETERFPFDDNSFDVAIWSEVIEHLTQNPVHTLGEVYRVLKPGGCVIISTPNASRADSVLTLARGYNIYDPYHLGAVLAGSRHSREYTYAELVDLVRGCGYEVDRAEDIDIYPPWSRLSRVVRALLNRVVSRVTKGHYRFHLFVRAKKTDAPFRAYFPESLFDQGHLNFHLAPTSAKVVMGWNEAPHIFAGWGGLRKAADGAQVRRSAAVGDVYIVGTGSAVRIRLANGKGDAQLWHDKPELVSLGSVPFEAGAELTEVVVPLSGPYDPVIPVHVRFDVPGGVDVATVELV